MAGSLVLLIREPIQWGNSMIIFIEYSENMTSELELDRSCQTIPSETGACYQRYVAFTSYVLCVWCVTI